MSDDKIKDLGKLLNDIEKQADEQKKQYDAQAKQASSTRLKLRQTAESLSKVYTEVKKVIDGDTVELADGTRIRVAGIDTFESQLNIKLEEDVKRYNMSKDEMLAKGQAAKEQLRKLIADSGSKVKISSDSSIDAYGRVVAFLETESGMDIGAEMLRSGNANLISGTGLSSSRIVEYEKIAEQARKAAQSTRSSIVEINKASNQLSKSFTGVIERKKAENTVLDKMISNGNAAKSVIRDQERKLSALERTFKVLGAMETSDAFYRAGYLGENFFQTYGKDVYYSLASAVTGKEQSPYQKYNFQNILTKAGMTDRPGKLDSSDVLGPLGDFFTDPSAIVSGPAEWGLKGLAGAAKFGGKMAGKTALGAKIGDKFSDLFDIYANINRTLSPEHADAFKDAHTKFVGRKDQALAAGQPVKYAQGEFYKEINKLIADGADSRVIGDFVDNNITAIQGPKGAFQQKYENLLQKYKAAVTIYHPSFHLRNWLSGELTNKFLGTGSKTGPSLGEAMAGKGLFTRKISSDIRGGKDHWLESDIGEKMTYEQLRQEMMDYGILSQSGPADLQKGAGGLWGTINNATGKAGTWVEDQVRSNAFLYNRYKGMNPWESSRAVTKRQFEYRNDFYTPFERKWMMNLMPFYKYEKGNFLANTKYGNELLGANMNRFRFGEKFADDNSQDTRPWMHNMVTLGGVGGFGTIFEDFANTLTDPKRAAFAKASPALRIPYELSTGTESFSGKDIASNIDGSMYRNFPEAVKDMLGYRVSEYGRETIDHPYLSYLARAFGGGRFFNSYAGVTNPEKGGIFDYFSPLKNYNSSMVPSKTLDETRPGSEGSFSDGSPWFFMNKASAGSRIGAAGTGQEVTVMADKVVVSPGGSGGSGGDPGASGGGFIGDYSGMTPERKTATQTAIVQWAQRYGMPVDQYRTSPAVLTGSETDRRHFMVEAARMQGDAMIKEAMQSGDFGERDAARMAAEEFRLKFNMFLNDVAPELQERYLEALRTEYKAKGPVRKGEAPPIKADDVTKYRVYQGDRSDAWWHQYLTEDLQKLKSSASSGLVQAMGTDTVDAINEKRKSALEQLAMKLASSPVQFSDTELQEIEDKINDTWAVDMMKLNQKTTEALAKFKGKAIDGMIDSVEKFALKSENEIQQFFSSKDYSNMTEIQRDSVVKLIEQARDQQINKFQLKEAQDIAKTNQSAIKQVLETAMKETENVFNLGNQTIEEYFNKQRELITKNYKDIIDELQKLLKKQIAGGAKPSDIKETENRIAIAEGDLKKDITGVDLKERDSKYQAMQKYYGVQQSIASMRSSYAQGGWSRQTDYAGQQAAFKQSYDAETESQAAKIAKELQGLAEKEDTINMYRAERAKKYEDDIAKIRSDSMKFQINTVSSGLGMLTDLFEQFYEASGSESKTMFRLMKAAAMAEALVKGALATLNAYEKGMSLGGPAVAAAYAGMAAAVTGVQVGVIASQMIHAKDGGKITQGSGYKDDVPAVLMKDEFVMKQSAVRKYGDKFMELINEGMLEVPKDFLQNGVGKLVPMTITASMPKRAYADGGVVLGSNGSPFNQQGKDKLDVKIINVVDHRSAFDQYMNSPHGQNVLLNVIGANGSILRRSIF